jgi:hypothetical protein
VILLFLLNPRSLPSIFFSAALGYICCPLFIGLSHGFVEFGITVSAFILIHKLSTGKVREHRTGA